MFPKTFRKVAGTLKLALALNKSRADCFAAFVMAAAGAKSIPFDDVARRLPGAALGKSKFHRLQDFFREVKLDFNAVSRMVMGFADKTGGKPVVLSPDRTGWKTRGGREDNLLILGVCRCTASAGISGSASRSSKRTASIRNPAACGVTAKSNAFRPPWRWPRRGAAPADSGASTPSLRSNAKNTDDPDKVSSQEDWRY